MKKYTDEFIQAIETIEGIVEVRLGSLAEELNKDSMIECRNLTIGDTNEFRGGHHIHSNLYSLDIEEYMSRKLSVEEMGNNIAKEVEKYILQLIEDKIENSTTSIKTLKDTRKIIKVVINQDVVIQYSNLGLSFRVGIEEFKRFNG